jgi:hypothetical protein
MQENCTREENHMNGLKLLAAIAFTALLGAPAYADQGRAEEIASVLKGMNHLPSDADKAALAAVAADDSASANLHTIAAAIGRIAHQPAEADRPALQAIADDEEASENERTLARAVLGFNHKVSDADATALDDLD